VQTALPAARLLPAQLLLLPPPVLPAVALHLLLLLAADLNCWASRRKADPRIELTDSDRFALSGASGTEGVDQQALQRSRPEISHASGDAGLMQRVHYSGITNSTP
jgi:hypothetical protein